ncbi:MAG: DUF1552 domain-containing protein [Bradymonadia bacterium]
MDRRAFLKYLGAAGLAPFIPSFARGSDTEFPTRFIVFYQPNGTKKELWTPAGEPTERVFELGSILQPLNSFKDNLVLVDGLQLSAAKVGPGGPHQRGMAALLTGAEIMEGDFVGGDGRKAGWGGGMSVDQYAIQRLRPGTPLSSLELGVRVMENIPRSRLIYGGPEQPLPPDNDPLSVYGRIFGANDQRTSSPEERSDKLVKRSSVLDSVHQDFAKLKTLLGGADWRKLDQHATSVRELERRLTLLAEQSAVCGITEPAEVANPMTEEQFRSVLRAQIDLTVAAFACDATRFSSIQCSSAVNALRFTFMGLNQYEGHGLSHAGDSNANLQTQWEAMLTWYSEQLAYLLQRLASIPEGNGTMLDNTLVLCVNEISRGNTHSHDDMHFLLAGGAGGRLEGGRYLRYDDRPHNDLLVSVLNLLELDDETFGDQRFCYGALPGLV